MAILEANARRERARSDGSTPYWTLTLGDLLSKWDNLIQSRPGRGERDPATVPEAILRMEREAREDAARFAPARRVE